MILSIAIITREVRATGLRAFRTLTVPFFVIGITVDCFHISGNIPWVRELWNRSWNIFPSCSVQYIRVQLQMLSGLGAVFKM